MHNGASHLASTPRLRDALPCHSPLAFTARLYAGTAEQDETIILQRGSDIALQRPLGPSCLSCAFRSLWKDVCNHSMGIIVQYRRILTVPSPIRSHNDSHQKTQLAPIRPLTSTRLPSVIRLCHRYTMHRHP